MKKISFHILSVIILNLVLILIVACGGDSKPDQNTSDKSNISGLPEWESKNGFGPIKKKLYLLPIDKEMVAAGEKIFESKCASCHKLDERYVGPAQRNVLQRVTPEFFMNMVLNPEENLEKHPHTKQMLAEYMQKMTNQNINLEDARKLLEYFRLIDEELKNNNQPSK
ncbi:MAG: cytochrome c [Ignavibacteria bacterium]|nr:cytochrome c [Ignavibacteria bacterium]